MGDRKAIIFIFITVMLEMIGFGLIIPVIPALLEQLTGADVEEQAILGMWLLIAFAGMQFLFSPFMGELSDRFGRKPILLACLLMLSFDYVLHAIAPTFGLLVIGRLLAGFTGASHTVATAYMADISSAKDKAKNFGLIGAAFGLGFIIGPAVGGIFGGIDIRLPFFLAAGFSFFNFLFGLFFIKESLAPELKRAIDPSKMVPGVSLFQLKRYKGIGWLLFAFFLVNLAGQALPSTWSYFTIEVFDWDEAAIGWSLAAVGFLVAIVQGVLVNVAVKAWGQKKTIMIGFAFWSVGMFLFGLAIEPWMLYLFLIPYAIGGIAGPTLQGLVSNQVPDNEQGNLQGAITSLVSLTSIIGPLLSSPVFSYFIGDSSPFYFPGAPYALSAMLLVIASVVAFFALRKVDMGDGASSLIS